MHTFFENVKVIEHGMDAATSTVMGHDDNAVSCRTGWVDMAKYDKAIGIGVAMCASITKAVTIQMWEASDATGGGSATLAGKTDSATAATASNVVRVGAEVDGEELSAGFRYVAAELTSAASLGSDSRLAVVIARANPRYAAV